MNGKRGLIPANFVRIVPMNAECRALYDFQISSPEQVDCLSFQKDEVITIIRKVDQNWAEGRIGDRVGIFPISFVECNPAAKSLLESQCVTPPTPVSTPVADQPVAQQITACGSPLSNPNETVAKEFSVPSIQASIPSIQASIPSIQASVPSIQASVPSSIQVEVSTGINVVTTSNAASSNGVYEKLVNKRHSFCEVPSEAPVLLHQRSKSHVIGDTLSGQGNRNMVDQPNPEAVVVRGTPFVHEIAVPIYYVAIYNYRPQKPDELELRKGEIYVVSEKCQDGWYRGRSLRTSVQGVFPGNYVQVARSLPPSDHRVATSDRSQGQPPPLLPKPKLNGSLLPTNPVAPSIYAKPRNSPTTLPWVVAAKPPRSLPLSSSSLHSPDKSDSTPSPQWPAVYVSLSLLF